MHHINVHFEPAAQRSYLSSEIYFDYVSCCLRETKRQQTSVEKGDGVAALFFSRSFGSKASSGFLAGYRKRLPGSANISHKILI